MAFINSTNSEGREGINVNDNHLVGDATTQRLVGDAYTRLKRYTCPQSRIFILLRDPVERCYRYVSRKLIFCNGCGAPLSDLEPTRLFCEIPYHVVILVKPTHDWSSCVCSYYDMVSHFHSS